MRTHLARTAVLIAAVAFAIGSAQPAAANDGVYVLQGTATTNNLGLPVLTGGAGAWAINTATCTGVSVHPVIAVGGCGLVANGALLPVGTPFGVTLGASCFLSRGTGTGVFTTIGHPHNIVVDWPASAGTIIPVFGRMDDGSGIWALVRASANPEPVTPCLAGTANTFAVIAVVAVL